MKILQFHTCNVVTFFATGPLHQTNLLVFTMNNNLRLLWGVFTSRKVICCACSFIIYFIKVLLICISVDFFFIYEDIKV
jgi:hypothetical protein